MGINIHCRAGVFYRLAAGQNQPLKNVQTASRQKPNLQSCTNWVCEPLRPNLAPCRPTPAHTSIQFICDSLILPDPNALSNVSLLNTRKN